MKIKQKIITLLPAMRGSIIKEDEKRFLKRSKGFHISPFQGEDLYEKLEDFLVDQGICSF